MRGSLSELGCALGSARAEWRKNQRPSLQKGRAEPACAALQLRGVMNPRSPR